MIWKYGIPAAALLMIFMGGWLAKTSIMFWSGAKRTNGKVISVRKDEDADSVSYTPTIAYRDNAGKLHEATTDLASGSYNYTIGSEVRIAYNHAVSPQIRIGSVAVSVSFGTIFFFCGLFMLGAALHHFWEIPVCPPGGPADRLLNCAKPGAWDAPDWLRIASAIPVSAFLFWITLWLGPIWLFQKLRFLANANRAIATISAVSTSRNGDGTTYHPVISFEDAERQKHTLTQKYFDREKPYTVGETFPIIYNLSDPEPVQRPTPLYFFPGTIFSTLLALFFGLMTIGLIYQMMFGIPLDLTWIRRSFQ